MNPWTDINAWKEFLWDMRHPGQLWDRMKEGTREAMNDWVSYLNAKKP